MAHLVITRVDFIRSLNIYSTGTLIVIIKGARNPHYYLSRAVTPVWMGCIAL
jgi:hypothetical protein